MVEKEGRWRSHSSGQDLRTEMNFSCSSAAEDARGRDFLRGGGVMVEECNWQGESAGEGLWPSIHEMTGP